MSGLGAQESAEDGRIVAIVRGCGGGVEVPFTSANVVVFSRHYERFFEYAFSKAD